MTKRANPIRFLGQVERMLKQHADEGYALRVERRFPRNKKEIAGDDIDMWMRSSRPYGGRNGIVFGKATSKSEEHYVFELAHIMKVWAESNEIRLRFWTGAERKAPIERFKFANMLVLDKSATTDLVIQSTESFTLPDDAERAIEAIEKIAKQIVDYWSSQK